MRRQYTNWLVDFIFELKNKKLNQKDIHQIKRAILDYYCAAITGSQTEISNRLFNYLNTHDTQRQVSIIGYKEKLSIENAAFLNGTSGHCLDFDDGHSGGAFHPGTVIIPAILSVSEELDIKSEEFFKAVIIGYEISIRIASAIHPSSRKNGFHNTPVAGIFGAVSSISFLMGMDRTKTLEALGIAGSFTSGLFAFLGSGSEIKRLHPGKAAKDAILAVKLTEHGISGPTDILENENGIFKAFASDDIKEENLLADLDNNFLIHDIYFKPYPCCRHLHSGIDAIYHLKEKKIIDINEIKNIKVGVNEIAYLHRHKNCSTLLDSQMSLPHAIASALYYEQLNVGGFKPEQIPEKVIKLREIIDIYVDEYADKEYPDKRVSKISIEFEDGTKLFEQVDTPLGEPDNPINDQQLRNKFINNCKGIIGESQSKEFVNKMDQWDINSEYRFLFNV